MSIMKCKNSESGGPGPLCSVSSCIWIRQMEHGEGFLYVVMLHITGRCFAGCNVNGWYSTGCRFIGRYSADCHIIGGYSADCHVT